jgi:hypothetical protein
MYDIYFCLLRDTATLVKRHWQAIERVAKALERHDVSIRLSLTD